jgi:hypothetical protein
MAEDIKKVIVVVFRISDSGPISEKAKDQKLPTLGRFVQEGASADKLINSLPTPIQIVTLLTGALPETHGVRKAGQSSCAEYIWEAAQKSSKKTALFGLSIDRAPASADPSATPASISSFLRTSPDWDLCFAFLQGATTGIPVMAEAVDKALSEILRVADSEALSILVALPGKEEGGFIAINGPGVRKGASLKRNVKIEDIVPTLCYLGEISVPANCEGGILYQAIEDPDMKIKELRSCRRNYERLKRSSGPSAMC